MKVAICSGHKFTRIKLKLQIVGMFELPRKRKVPKKMQIGGGEPRNPNSAKQFYKYIYLEVIDFTMSSIQSRFEHRGYKVIQILEALINPNIIEMQVQDMLQV